MQMQALGIQILVEFHECDQDVLRDRDLIEKLMVQASVEAKATVVKSTFHEFSPHGVSGVVVIAESHVAIHTWPEYGYAAVDIFTCGETIQPWVIFKILKEGFKSTHANSMELRRGLFDMGLERLKHKPDA